jgi:hypothetical protein
VSRSSSFAIVSVTEYPFVQQSSATFANLLPVRTTTAIQRQGLLSHGRTFVVPHGAFRWPPITDGVMKLSSAQLAALVDGMDWSRLHARDVTRPTATS